MAFGWPASDYDPDSDSVLVKHFRASLSKKFGIRTITQSEKLAAYANSVALLMKTSLKMDFNHPQTIRP